MRKIISLFSLVVLSITIFAQDKVLRVEELSNYGLSMEQLDSIYKNGLPASDTIHPLFTQVYFDSIVEKSRHDLLQKIGDYFIENGLEMDPSVRCWNRMYYSSEGTIEYLAYHFIDPIAEDKELEFKRLLNIFIKGNVNKASVVASQKYSICGSVVWKE